MLRGLMAGVGGGQGGSLEFLVVMNQPLYCGL